MSLKTWFASTVPIHPGWSCYSFIYLSSCRGITGRVFEIVHVGSIPKEVSEDPLVTPQLRVNLPKIIRHQVFEKTRFSMGLWVIRLLFQKNPAQFITDISLPLLDNRRSVVGVSEFACLYSDMYDRRQDLQVFRTYKPPFLPCFESRKHARKCLKEMFPALQLFNGDPSWAFYFLSYGCVLYPN